VTRRTALHGVCPSGFSFSLGFCRSRQFGVLLEDQCQMESCLFMKLNKLLLGGGLGAFIIGVCLFGMAIWNPLQTTQEEEFFKAVGDGDVRKVETLLKASPQLLEARNRLGLTPILEAAYDGKTKVAKVLIRSGGDVNATWNVPGEQEGFNPLHVSAINGHLDIAQLLIRGGTKINTKSALGETPLDVAIQNGHKKLADLFKANGGRKGAKGG
jgi:hypothetical protein